VSFNDGAVNAGGESEIICIDDEAAHRVSLAGQSLCRRRRAVACGDDLHHSAELHVFDRFFPARVHSLKRYSRSPSSEPGRVRSG
jgi:hypothetical protein